MRKRAGVDDDALRLGDLALKEVYDFPLGIRLETDDRHLQVVAAQSEPLFDLPEGGGAVDRRPPHAERVEVGAVHDEDAHSSRRIIRERTSTFSPGSPG